MKWHEIISENNTPDSQYHTDTHQQLLFKSQKEKRYSTGAANYYHRSANEHLHPDLEAYYETHVEPLLKSAGYPKVGSAEHHDVIKKIVDNWRHESIDPKIMDL